MSTLASEISVGWGVSSVALGYTLLKTDGTTAQARTTSGVSEDGTSGIYLVRPTFDSTWGKMVTVRWDDGAGNVARDTFTNPAYGTTSSAVAVTTVGPFPAGQIVADQFTSTTTNISTATLAVTRNGSTVSPTIVSQTSTLVAYTLDQTSYTAADRIIATLTYPGGSAVHRWAVVASNAGEGTGNGDVAVNHNYGGTDALRILASDGTTPVDNAIIRAYVTADYNADVIDPNPPTTTTGSDGRFIAPLMLDAGAYTLNVYNPVTKRAKLFPLTVS